MVPIFVLGSDDTLHQSRLEQCHWTSYLKDYLKEYLSCRFAEGMARARDAAKGVDT